MQHKHSCSGPSDFYRLEVAICVRVQVSVAPGEGDLDEICCMKEMCAHQLRVPTHSQKHLRGSDKHTHTLTQRHTDRPSDDSPVLQNQHLVCV